MLIGQVLNNLAVLAKRQGKLSKAVQFLKDIVLIEEQAPELRSDLA
jgi:Flp pilus assembly protein TadD